MNQRGFAGVITAAIAAPAALILGLVLAVASLGSPANACAAATGVVDATKIPADANVAGFSQSQLANAAAIVNAASALGLPPAAQTIGVQAAIGESSLVNIGYGDEGDGVTNPDGSPTCSLGLFQQQWCLGDWGSKEQVMDPTYAATAFYQRLVGVAGWEGLEPSVAINAVQINADPYHYTKFRAASVEVTAYLAELGGGSSGGGCSVSGDAQQLAQGLQAAMDNGTLTLLESRYAEQITNMANGTAVEGCKLDVRTLQFITLALDKFGNIGLSDLNRQCTGSLLGAGEGSSHWVKGGGMGVDFTVVGGAALDGRNSESLALIDLLSSVAPDGTRVGQIQCRSGQTWPHLTEIVDSCNHVHIDFAYTDQPLNITS
ncbi:hypothetical protein ACQ3HE_19335 [Plantibacter auratus]|uniref:hypothetical protein n=1 Tax=Plantibacter auratus TaxID=272914 RepID=UPI003D327BF0